MKTVGPFVAARALDTPPKHGAARPVVTLHALDRLTGMPALVYLLPQAVSLPELPESPSLLPYAEVGVQHGQAYVACELPPHAAQARDPLQTALGGLRALNALHEAGLLHGGVGPAQLWEWNGDVRLGGAGLPWGEAQGALAAPEGGSSAAADLYALGVTLLRMGPLPAGLSDLLSPYPAQRPSARDALARFNAGPPLPPERTPLIVEVPLRPRNAEQVSAEPEPTASLPLVADPDGSPAEPEMTLAAAPDTPLSSSAPSIPLVASSVGAGPVVPEPPAAPALTAVDLKKPQPGPSPSASLLDWDEVQGTEQAGEITAAPATVPETVQPPVVPQPVSLIKGGAVPVQSGEVHSGEVHSGEPLVIAAALQSALLPGSAPDSVPGSVETVAQSASALTDTADTAPVNPTLTDTAPAELDPALGRASRRLSPRQLKPVKIGWSQDGSWKAVKEGGEAPRSGGAFNPAWLPVWLVGALLLVLAAVFTPRLLGRAPAVIAPGPGCCTVTSQLIGSSGEALSAPVNIKLVSAPDGSQLQAGALVGQAPGPLKFDVPGPYTLSVTADGYASQDIDLTVPTQEDLKIVLR